MKDRDFLLLPIPPKLSVQVSNKLMELTELMEQLKYILQILTRDVLANEAGALATRVFKDQNDSGNDSVISENITTYTLY